MPEARPARLKRRLRRTVYILLSLLLIWIVSVQLGCMAMRTPDRDWPKKLQDKGQALAPQFLDATGPAGRRIHAVMVSAADTLPLVLLVHGSPGASDAYLDYLADTSLSKLARLLAVDRPGFGYTEGFGRPEPSLGIQTAMLKAVADKVAPGQRIVLVGHSLGGPLVARFAMDYPDQTAGIVIAAGSIDPDQEEHPWWQAALDGPPLQWLTPKSLWASNHEIRYLEDELRLMVPRWPEIRCPVIVLHAQDDRLVPVANADFARRMMGQLPGLQVDLLPEGDHFILWNHRGVVTEAIKKMLVLSY